MKAFLLSGLLVASVSAASPFDGTWVTKPEKVTPDKKPWVINLEKGIWTSDLASPPVKVKADGTDQASPHLAFTTVTVKVLGPAGVEVTSKKSGRVVYVRTLSVAADGKTMVSSWTDRTGPQEATGQTVFERLSRGSSSAHAVSGTWRAVKEQNLSTNASTATYKNTVEGMTLVLGTGLSYRAKFDGKDYPVAGDAAGGQTVSLKRHGDRSFTETYKRGGKVVEIDRVSVGSDGKTLRVEWELPTEKRGGSYEAVKQ